MTKPVAIDTAPELLTCVEVAVFLRTSLKAVYAMVERGQLPGIVRLGRRVLVRRDDLRRHVGLCTASTSGDGIVVSSAAGS